MIKTCSLKKIYRTEEVETTALNNVNMEVSEGEFVAIMGPSGCGKSTLLNLLGLLDNPTDGAYHFLGQEVSGYSERQRANLRKAKMFDVDLRGAELVRLDFRRTSEKSLTNIVKEIFGGIYYSFVEERDYIADLRGAFLVKSNLQRAEATYRQLRKASLLDFTIMPDGEVYDPELHGKLGIKDRILQALLM